MPFVKCRREGDSSEQSVTLTTATINGNKLNPYIDMDGAGMILVKLNEIIEVVNSIARQIDKLEKER